MDNKLKIISLGNNQANWVVNLYKSILKIDNSFVFEADNFFDLSKQSQATPFVKTYNLKTNFSLKKDGIKYFTFFLNKIYKDDYGFVKSIGSKKQIKNFKSLYFKGFLSYKLFFSKNNYDIYHFHFLKFEYIYQLFFLPKKEKVICSFWGSDLFRTENKFQFYFQQKALKRANIITLHNEEMEEFVLTKFGKELKPKIRKTLFPLDSKLFKLIDTYQTEVNKIDTFKSEILTTDNKKKIVAIGHNANKHNNHIAILNELKNIPHELKKDIQFVFLMTYGEVNKEGYIKEISKLCKSQSLNHLFITEYLSVDDLALFKLATDVFIHLPNSDAMSGSLTEAAYAGSNIITGSWLPYSKFSKAGLCFSKISSFNELIPQLIYELDNPITLSDKTKNISGIKSTFFENKIAPDWVAVYKELLNT